MKNLAIAITAVLAASMALAHPPKPPPRAVHIPVARQIRRPMLPPPPRHHHSFWGPGGRNFWPGFAGAVVGSAIFGPPPPPPPVTCIGVAPVWIAPLYEQRPVYDAYGRVIRYERVLVRAGYWQY